MLLARFQGIGLARAGLYVFGHDRYPGLILNSPRAQAVSRGAALHREHVLNAEFVCSAGQFTSCPITETFACFRHDQLEQADLISADHVVGSP